MPRTATRPVTLLTILQGLVLLSAAVAPSAIDRAPGNDTFGHALKIGSLPYLHAEGTRRAKSADSAPASSGIPAAHPVWFELNRSAPTDIPTGTRGGDFDTILAAYEETGSRVDGLIEVDCNDAAVPGAVSSDILFTAGANTTYYLLAGSSCGHPAGRLDLTVAEQ